ncbi:DsbC family protein [uncultured Acinetobacter sp.]|uniref:DsbC family protein n=1 Tax=uncultured Acinetobacter sp. TaxID=165433 RepID=UPI00259130C9|nr:DsbC family protein [uncultured Acinetobacter sp.]
MIKQLCALMVLATATSLTFADVNAVQKQLQQKHPSLKIENIQTTEMPGVYSGFVEDQVIYVSENADYIIAGSMIRLKDQKNLTKQLMMNQQKTDWNKLPFQDAIKSVRGNGKRQIAIFSDPNCPYCKRLELELAKLNDITIYTFVTALKPQSVTPSKQVFCEASPELAWNNLIVKGIQPKSSKSCANPIERNLKLAKSLKLGGTPGIVFANGAIVTGASPAAELEEMLKEAQP